MGMFRHPRLHPACADQPRGPIPPMAYSQSLAAMRHFLTIPWQDSTKPVPVTPEESRAFTLHSQKVCLLAAGAQVRATEEARQHQGHHKSPSVQICLACAQGWRPARPHSQGGPASYLGAPFSRRQIAAQAGLSGFIFWGRGVTLRLAIPQVPDFAQEPQPNHQPEPTAAQIPEDDTEALLVEKFANQAHSSSESEDEPKEARKPQLSTFSLFRNGPWGVIHACRQGDD